MQPDDATPAGSRIPSERQRGFLNALLENIDDGIVACDAEGVLTVFNHAARALDSGFQAYVAKPVEPFELANAVARLKKSGDTRQL